MATIIVLGVLALVAALALGLVSETAATALSVVVEVVFLLVLAALFVGGLAVLVWSVFMLGSIL